MSTKSVECLMGKPWLQRLSDLCTGGRGRVMSTKSFECLGKTLAAKKFQACGVF